MLNANQTRFHLLLGRGDWSQCTADTGLQVFVSPAGAVAPFSWDQNHSELTLGARINVFHGAPKDIPPTLDQRRGAAQDRFGNWYWIAESGTEILVASSGTGITSHFWSSQDEAPGTHATGGTFGACAPATPPAPLAFSGMAVTTEHYMVAGVTEPAGLVIFDLFHGGPPRQVYWPAAIPFVPFDMTPTQDGGLWILDRSNARLWQLDRAFGVVRNNQSQIDLSGPAPDVFQPASGAPTPVAPKSFPAGVSLDAASPLRTIDAIAVEALPDGSVLLLESNPSAQFSTVYRFRDGSLLGDSVSVEAVAELLEPEDRPGFVLLGVDFTFIATEQTLAGPRQNTLYLAGQNGDQSWAFAVNFSTDQIQLAPYAEYYPMRLFGGRGVVAGQTQVYYDSQAHWVPLVMQNRPRFVETATVYTQVFDGKQPDCVWDRLMLDASIPTETSVQIWSRANNDKTALTSQDWGTPEPTPYLRGNGTELPWTTNVACEDTWELLFQQAVGRYLQLKITLAGNSRLTPRVRALRAYYPRFSYLTHYLPGVYQEDVPSAWFLDRFLSNIEGFYTSIEDRIASVQALFDPGSIPASSLDWLANWFGVAFDPAWSEAKRRLFLRYATTFFEARGTVPGLLMTLRLAIENCTDPTIFSAPSSGTGIRIVEGYSNRQLPPGLFTDPVAETGLPVKTQTALWTPVQGASDLDQRYAASLGSSGATYPISLSTSDPQYAAWSDFSRKTLGLLPAQPDAGAELWVVFLRTRYRTLKALRVIYGSTIASFDDVPFATELPRQTLPLWDWYQFQGVLLIAAAAHQFTVFLPMPLADAQNTLAHRNKLNLAQRVVDLEKPVHTTYEIKFYWAFFRVGEARLGRDTVLDYGSRAPQLLRPMLLGDNYLGSGYLSRSQPGSPRDRPFLQGVC
jgi:phage tail-like protein